jgi:CheY-like chemotaxis protein
VDAMPGGGTLTLRTAPGDGGRALVAVEDDGEGMAPEVLARVREPFFTTKEVGRGTGLGVSMTHGVVKVHGGTMEIASTPGQGTTVTLGFARIPAPAPAAAAAPPAPGPSLELLLVDDDEDVRFLVARLLQRAGHRLRTAAGGAQALAALAAEGLPDLVILDQNMPGMDGIQTMEKIRERYPDLPILISSGQPDIEDWPCFRQPNVAVIPKPFEAAEIYAKLSLVRPR